MSEKNANVDVLQLVQQAHPLPWEADIDDLEHGGWCWTGKFFVGHDEGTWCTYLISEPGSAQSARDLASLRLIEAIPEMVKEIENLRAELTALRAKG
jgi:hypothetical protein